MIHLVSTTIVCCNIQRNSFIRETWIDTNECCRHCSAKSSEVWIQRRITANTVNDYTTLVITFVISQFEHKCRITYDSIVTITIGYLIQSLVNCIYFTVQQTQVSFQINPEIAQVKYWRQSKIEFKTFIFKVSRIYFGLCKTCSV